MGTLSRDVVIAAPADRVWSVLVDWPRHSRWVPLTDVRRITPARGVGERFAGRTGLGPRRVLGFDDVMEVLVWQPPQGGAPGRCEVVKQGRVLHGGAVIEVLPVDSLTTRVRWAYRELSLGPQWLVGVIPARAGRVLDQLLDRFVGAGLTRVLDAARGEVEGAAG